MRKPGVMKTGAILAALLLPACGSANQDAIEASGVACPEGSDCFDEVRPVGLGSALTIESGDLWFRFDGVRSDQEQLTIEAIEGDLALTLENVGAGVHNFRIDETIAETDDGKKVEALGGETATGTLPLFSGTYTFYCDIPGHRTAGMEGELQVLTAAQAEEAGSADAEDGEVDETEPAEDESPSEEASPADEESADSA